MIEKLSAKGLAYLCLLEPNAQALQRGVQIERVAETFKPLVTVPLIVNTGFDKAKANAVLAAGGADLVAFGAPYIANPDLVRRFREDAPLNKPNPATFYGVGPDGYTDYPALES